MKKMKKYLALVLAFALAIGATAAITMALLTDEDSAVNTMVVGNVNIEQMEYQRVVAEDNYDGNGDFKLADEQYKATFGSDTYHPDALEEFKQDKPWLPVTTKDLGWDDRNGSQNSAGAGSHQQSWKEVGAPGSNQLFDAQQGNVIDKFVFVKNTGLSDAYYRTIIAVEVPAGLPEDRVHTSFNATSRFDYNVEQDGNQTAADANAFLCTINGVQYLVYTATYTEILTPGETSRPSLLQLYLDFETTNREIALFGEKMDVLVLSQAVQASGFNSANEALTTAFGEVNAQNVFNWFGGVLPEQEPVTGTNKAAVVAAIEAAKPGDTVVLTEDSTIAGYNGGDKLIIDKPITLDLNGKTLTTESGWGGIDLKGGASIKNGTINHTGNTAAIKAFQVDAIENVTINMTQTAGKVKGGIVIQEGAGCYVNSIKNVTITGATNGIETYRCGARDDYAIGSMENVTIDATDTGMKLSAPVGTIRNCTIKGGNIGIDAYLYGPYSVTANLENCTVEGGNAALYAHDEAGVTNPGKLTITYTGTTFNGAITQEFETEVKSRVSVTAK